MKEDKDKFPTPNREEKYREAGVEGNDQNKAIHSVADEKAPVQGNAEKSERGKAEFEADQGIKTQDEKPDCQTLSENGKDLHSDRAQTEFREDLD